MALMIYGATGYTGRLASSNAKDLGLNFIVAARSEQSVKELAESLNVTGRAFDLTDPATIDSYLDGVSVLLNCAGPYKYTAEIFIQSCIRKRVHYLDIAAELDSYKMSQSLDEEAQAAGILLLPGCGGSAAMMGTLTAFALKQARNAVKVDVALYIAGPVSQGTANCAAETSTAELLRLEDGNLVKQDGGPMAFDFDDGKGKVDCYPVTMPDLVTLHRSTNIGNVQTFVYMPESWFGLREVAGPTKQEREANPYHGAVAITDKDGQIRRAVIHTVNGYTFTSLAPVHAAKRILEGEVKSGFQTSSTLFGSDFFTDSIAGSVLKEGPKEV